LCGIFRDVYSFEAFVFNLRVAPPNVEFFNIGKNVMKLAEPTEI